jgi:hypothetical protein
VVDEGWFDGAMRPDRFAAPAGQPTRPKVEVLSIIIALSSTREDVTAPCGWPCMWFGGLILQERAL